MCVPPRSADRARSAAHRRRCTMPNGSGTPNGSTAASELNRSSRSRRCAARRTGPRCPPRISERGGGQTPNKPWLVFGLDRRNENAVRNAVQHGYRRFDVAESYGASTDTLAREIGDSGSPGPTSRCRASSAYGRTRRTSSCEAWNVMRDMKRDGWIGKLGVGDMLPEHVSLLRELKTEEPVEVVRLSPLNSPRGSRRGSRQGSPKGADRTLGETSSDRSSPRSTWRCAGPTTRRSSRTVSLEKVRPLFDKPDANRAPPVRTPSPTRRVRRPAPVASRHRGRVPLGPDRIGPDRTGYGSAGVLVHARRLLGAMGAGLAAGERALGIP